MTTLSDVSVCSIASRDRVAFGVCIALLISVRAKLIFFNAMITSVRVVRVAKSLGSLATTTFKRICVRVVLGLFFNPNIRDALLLLT